MMVCERRGSRNNPPERAQRLSLRGWPLVARPSPSSLNNPRVRQTTIENSQGTLSVLIPNYNHAHFVEEALQSLLEQSFSPFEIIIVDDASTDNSVEVLQAYAQRERRIRLVQNDQNRGVVYNLNRLLEWASGDYVMFVAADDKLLPRFFEKCMGILAQYPKAGLCSTRTWVMPDAPDERFIPPDALDACKPIFFPPAQVRALLLSDGNWIHGNTCIYRRIALLEAGGFISELQSLTDSFAAQVIALRNGACFVPEPLAVWRYSASSYSGTTFNINHAPTLISRAAELMRSQYKDTFPAGYDKIWERETLFTLARVAYRAIRTQQSTFLEQQRSRQKVTNIFNVLCYGLLRVTIRVQALIALCYLVSGYWPKQAARRRFTKLCGR